MNNKKKHIGFLIMLLFFLVSIPILVKMLTDIVEVFNFNFSKVDNKYIMSIVFQKSTYLDLFKINNPFRALGLGFIAWYVLGYIINALGWFKPDDKYKQTEGYGSHGTSRWQYKNEVLSKYYKDKLGWFIGSVEDNKTYKVGMEAAHMPVGGKLNMQMTVIGPPGSQKTTGFVLNNIFHLPYAYKQRNETIDKILERRKEIEAKNNKVALRIFDYIKKTKQLKKEMPDLVITDPKSELYSLTAEQLEDKYGYEVRVLDFIHLKHGDSLNSLDYINDDKELMEIAQNYVDSVEGGSSSGDQAFWNSQEGQVLAALCGFVKQKYPKENQTFTDVAKILTSPQIKDIESASYFFEDNNIEGAAKQLWDNFLMIADSERTRANILGGLATKLKLFAIKGIQDITNHTTVDISKLGTKKDKPIALFIFMPDSDRTFSPIINVTISTIFKQLYKTAYKTFNRLENPVYFIIEEMANIGRINSIQEMLGTMRGRRIYPMMIWQSLSQMKARYKDGWEDILSMCDTTVYLGVNDEFTSKYCSNSLGNTTIKIQGISKKADDGLLTIEKRTESSNYMQRKLMLPEECIELSENKVIIRQRTNKPALLYKVQYKYWEEDVKICNPKDVFKLRPLGETSLRTINNVTNEEMQHLKEVEKVLTKKIEIERANNGIVNNITAESNIDKNEPEKEMEIQEVTPKEIEEEQEKSIDFSSLEVDEEMLNNFFSDKEQNNFELEI